MFKKLRERLNNKKNLFMSHVSQEVEDRVKDGGPITINEWKEFRGNSYERELLYPLMDDECLADTAKYFMAQAGITKLQNYELPDHYGDALSRKLVPLLIERLTPDDIFDEGLFPDLVSEHSDILSLVEECYEIDDNKEERAKAKRLVIVYPNKNQLQIDIDSEEDWDRLCLQLSNFELATQEEFGFTSITTSSSGEAHRHAVITLPWEIKSEWERVALQFALCSDFKRECLGAFRLAAGLKDVTCFFEKPVAQNESD